MVTELVKENLRRKALLEAARRYDPISGLGCAGPREDALSPSGDAVSLPKAMVDDPAYLTVARDLGAWRKLRLRHDFEYWAATCVTIRDKLTGRDVKFILNPPQRRVLGILERQRLAGLPLRLIMLKARQWGGSAL